jgi:hypothetical protein
VEVKGRSAGLATILWWTKDLKGYWQQIIDPMSDYQRTKKLLNTSIEMLPGKNKIRVFFVPHVFRPLSLPSHPITMLRNRIESE